MKNELWQLTFHKACKSFNRKEGFSLELVEVVLCGTEAKETSRTFITTPPDLVRQQARKAHKRTPSEDSPLSLVSQHK